MKQNIEIAIKKFNIWIAKGGCTDHKGVFVNYLKKAIKLDSSTQTIFKPAYLSIGFDNLGCVDSIVFQNAKGQIWREDKIGELNLLFSFVNYEAARPTLDDIGE